MTIQLSDHFNFPKLLRFTFPAVVMMVFTSIYNVVDGLFVSNYVGTTPFAAINLVMPFFMIIGAIGFMFSSGGNALVAKTLGSGNTLKAKRIFSLLTYACFIIGLTIALLSLLWIRPALTALGIEGALLEDAILYCKILMPAAPLFMLQYLFQAFMITAERPKLSMIITIAAGLANIILDALFISVYGWGLAGAAWASVIAMAIGGIVPFIYFLFPNKSPLRLCKTKFYAQALLKSCTNGASEFMSNISASIVLMLYNYQLLRLVGENGVVAYGVIAYVNFIFLSVFIGFAVGSNPLVSYQYGAKNSAELRNLFKMNYTFIILTSVFLMLGAEISARILVNIFVGYDEELLNMTTQAFRIYAVSFLLAGFNIYSSAFFTALNNGLVSAIIAFVRTLVCECGAVMIMPLFFGVTGIWTAIIVAEVFAMIVSVYYLKTLKRKYKY